MLCVLQILNSLVDQLELPVERADAAKHKYAKLHSCLVQAMSRERKVLEDAKALKKKLDVRLRVRGSSLVDMAALACIVTHATGHVSAG